MARMGHPLGGGKRAATALAGAGVCIAMLATMTPAPAVPAASFRAAPRRAENAPREGVLFGAYANAKRGQTIFNAVNGLQRKIDRRLAITAKYHPWTDHSYVFEAWNLDHGRLPLIKWRATDDVPDRDRARKIARGRFDGVIRRAADAMRALRGRVLVCWNWEMDQDRGQRQFIGSPAEYVAAWRHIHRIFEKRGAGNVEWVWAPRAGSFKKGEGQAYYPGDRYVDWIGGSAVPIQNYASFSDLFMTFYRWAIRRGKPILIWAGVQERPGNHDWKANWFDGARRAIEGKMPKLRALVYYHALAPLGGHYWVDTSRSSLAAYTRMGHDTHFAAMPGDGGSSGGGDPSLSA